LDPDTHDTTIAPTTKTRQQIRQRHVKHILRQLAQQESAFLERSINRAEQERTELAKQDKNNPHKLTIEANHKYKKHDIKLTQQGKNTLYNIGSRIKRGINRLDTTHKHVHFAATCKVRSFDIDQQPIMVTYDSGADGHYLSERDRKTASLPIPKHSNKRVGVANGGSSKAKFVTRLPIPLLSNKATQADLFADFPSSLMNVGKTADDGTISIFTKEGVTILKEEDVLIKCKREPILIGVRDEHGRYQIPLLQQKGQWQPRRPSARAKQALEKANSVYDLPSTEQAIKWMHAVCGYPVKSTWLKAIKAGNFVGWPLLTEKNVAKCYPETTETVKGHMTQTRKNVRSTKPKPHKFEVCNGAAALRNQKIQDIYITTYDVRMTIFSDQTGKYPTQSCSGNNYIMVMAEIDSNAILVEPMKSRKDQEMIRAYDALVKRLLRAGIQPKKHILDNEISEHMKEHIRDKYKFTLKLVPPGCHRHNAAEVAIRNFKTHFLSILTGTSTTFPPSLWDKLLPQTEITLNLLR
jgi:hypothetical protein